MELIELYLALFGTFLKIGLFGFGGGYAMLPLIQHEVVNTRGWISVNDFTDIVAISQTTPGPISFNSATYIGYTAVTEAGFGTLHGVIGAAVCTVAVSLPSLVLMTLVCAFLAKLCNNCRLQASLSILKPATIGLIAAAALMLINKQNFIDYYSWIIFGAVFSASFKKVDPILLIVLSGIVGLILY